jgi:MFS family permease
MRGAARNNLPTVTIGLAMAINFVSYLDRVCMSVAGPEIRKEFGFTATQFGWIFGVFSLSYALLQAPWGMLADRFGGRAIVAQAMCGWSALTAMTAAAYNLSSLIVIRFTFGALEAGLAPAVAAIIREAVPNGARSTAFGLFLSAGRLGGAFAPAVTAAIVLRAGWRAPFVIFAGIGVITVFAWLRVVRPCGHQPLTKVRLTIWRTLATLPVAALLLAAFAYTFMWQFYATWFPTYLIERFGYSLSQAGRYASLPFLFGIAGNWIGGYCVDQLSKSLGPRLGRTLLGSAALFISAVALIVGSRDSLPLRSIWELSAAAGLGDIFLSAAWTSSLELGGESAAALSGFMNTASNLGAMFSPVLLGWARERSGSWNFSLTLAACATVLASVVWPVVHSFGSARNSVAVSS